MHEYKALRQLHRAGAAVPRPYASTENAILMGYVGDRQLAAPTLSHVQLATDEAETLFQEVLRNVELMARHDLIHGDLSAYNVLYWGGAITLIDFPQVVDLYGNREARAILERDVTRICEYFARQGADHDPAPIVEDLWTRYGRPEMFDLAQDESYLESLLTP
jgi:RIO kinase 1